MSVMSQRRRIVKISTATADVQAQQRAQADDLSVEAPLNLVVDGEVIATLMRTPGHDVELAAGWLVVESGVQRPEDVHGLRQCRTDDDLVLRETDGLSGRGLDQVHLSLSPGVEPPRPRAWVTSAACGVCSADVLDLSPLRRAAPISDGWTVSAEVLAGLPDRLRTEQKVFSKTGSLHAAGLAVSTGDLLVVREDVGRHNAVDKVNGWAMVNGRLPLTDILLVVSGRVSFELVQKAVASSLAGIVAVSAPSDLAVDLAREHGLVLAGMVRNGRFNVYAGDERVLEPC